MTSSDLRSYCGAWFQDCDAAACGIGVGGYDYEGLENFLNSTSGVAGQSLYCCTVGASLDLSARDVSDSSLA